MKPRVSRVPSGAVATRLPGVSITFQSRPPYSRFDVVVSSPVDQAPSDDIARALLAIGFNRRVPDPLSTGSSDQRYEREGSGLCGGWSATERDRLTRDARMTLRRFGFNMVPEVRR